MVSLTLRHDDGGGSTGGKTKRVAAGVLQSITTLWLLCARQAIIASRKLKDNSKISPDSPMIQRPKKLINTISNKAIKLRHRKKRSGGVGNMKDDGGAEFGDDGLWQREILMGDKCQPLDFSGVIYYDREGNITNELPMRSPRASPFPRCAILVVGHGDPLQILQTILDAVGVGDGGGDVASRIEAIKVASVLSQHRKHALLTGQLRAVV